MSPVYVVEDEKGNWEFAFTPSAGTSTSVETAACKLLTELLYMFFAVKERKPVSKATVEDARKLCRYFDSCVNIHEVIERLYHALDLVC